MADLSPDQIYDLLNRAALAGRHQPERREPVCGQFEQCEPFGGRFELHAAQRREPLPGRFERE